MIKEKVDVQKEYYFGKSLLRINFLRRCNYKVHFFKKLVSCKGVTKGIDVYYKSSSISFCNNRMV